MDPEYGGLAVGTYVDTITVTAPGAVGSPGVVLDSMQITSGAAPLTVALNTASRHVVAQQGATVASDYFAVTLTGSNAANATWSAAKTASWATFTNSGATGTGSVLWTRSTAGLAVGTYVDTITVTAPGAVGSPGIVLDSMQITSGAAPLTVALNTASRHVVAPQGATVASDYFAVTLTGSNAANATWSAVKTANWATFTNASATGTGSVLWTRSTVGLAAGTYVDTITVIAPGAVGSPGVVLDTLQITAVSVPLVLTLSPGARSALAQQGTAAPSDNVMITLAGDNAATTTWSATKRKGWTTLTNASGTGSGFVSWNRSTTGLAVGTYIDTISVSAAGANGSPFMVFDTLKITAGRWPRCR